MNDISKLDSYGCVKPLKLQDSDKVRGDWFKSYGNMRKFTPTVNLRITMARLIQTGLGIREAYSLCGLNGNNTKVLYEQCPELKKYFSECKYKAQRLLISQSLRQLAEGSVKKEETIESFEEEELEDGSIRKVKRTIKTRIMPPDIKALKMLAYKYANGEYFENTVKELGIEVRITGQDRSLTIDERRKLIESDSNTVEVDYTALMVADIDGDSGGIDS